jgi:class 3 adenylate cyclase
VRHESVTILFTDLSGFTLAASTMPPDRMVSELNEIFAAFDRITDECGIEKIKTIGDAYMAAAGVVTPCTDHAQRCVRAALAMVAYLEQRNRAAAFKWGLRVGIHTGPVVAGVVGTKKFAFDVWGDTVNIASRMESAGVSGRVNISAYTYDLVRSAFACEYRGKINAKGKGEMDMYFVGQATA